MAAFGTQDRSPATTVAECLHLPELSEAAVVVPGNQDAEVRWASVIEWPVEDFVGRGDFVLTTAAGVTPQQLKEMFDQIAASGASAICLAAGPGAFHPAVPPEVIESTRRSDITVIEIPWRVRFSDVARGVIRLVNGFVVPSSDSGLPPEFSNALLGDKPVDDIAGALENAMSSPVAVLDAGLTPAGAGPRGTDRLAESGQAHRIADEIARSAGTNAPFPYRLLLQGRVAGSSAERATAHPAFARDGVVGWIVAYGAGGEQSELLRHALTAVSIALLRAIADDEASSYTREVLFWDLAHGSLAGEAALTSRVRLLGLLPSTEYRVAVGLLEPEGSSVSLLSPRAIAKTLRRRLTQRESILAVREHELLYCRTKGEPASPERLNAALPPNAGTISWGEADGWQTLETLGPAADQARIALSVTRALHGAGSIGSAVNLGTYMLISRFADDVQAQMLISRALGPLETADEGRNSEFVRTLEAFLEANGNISQAARALFLNRHSLIYRLKRMGELTGLDLESREDRFLLDLALRIRRLNPPHA